MAETRKSAHLRILQNGPSTEADNEHVKYLKEAGLADAEVRLSYEQATYGQPVEVMWFGPTASGLDYLEDLRAADAKQSIVQSGAEPDATHKASDQERLVNQPKPKKLKHLVRAGVSDITWSTIKTVVGIIAGGLAVYYLSTHLGLPL